MTQLNNLVPNEKMILLFLNHKKELLKLQSENLKINSLNIKERFTSRELSDCLNININHLRVYLHKLNKKKLIKLVKIGYNLEVIL